MTRYKPEHKAETRQKLVESAVTTFRRNGVDSAGLKQIMQEQGLTVGGFYRHFGSKSELVQSALAAGLAQSIEKMRQIVAQDTPGDAPDEMKWVERFSAGYLSETHRQNLADGCVLAALASDIARGDEEVKQVCEAGLLNIHAALRRGLSSDAAGSADLLWSLMAIEVGGLLLSRMVASEETAGEILESSRRAVRALAQKTLEQKRGEGGERSAKG